MKKIIFGVLLAALSTTAFCEQEVKIYFEDADSYPYSMKNKTGIDLNLLETVGKKVGVKFVYTLVPWERCLSTMQSGDADGFKEIYGRSWRFGQEDLGYYCRSKRVKRI
ncbi:MAG: hypothetical protein KBD76_15770 [Bacteriovorax sp.]|nr:hypothetical protein [Bacteriovorax sp.]